MTVVLNEHEYARDMIRAKTLGKKPAQTMERVARYYLDKKYSKRDVRKMLDAFLLQCDPNASLPRWADILDKILARASKRKALIADYIPVTEPEMRTIDALPTRQLRRLAFTLLCLAKYWDLAGEKDEHWVNTPDNEIMRMANINTSIDRQCKMYRELEDAGLLAFSKKIDNTHTRVLFVQDGETALKVSDFRNLGFQYQRAKGETYIECACCGLVVKPGGNRQKYCSACADGVTRRQKAESAVRRRLIQTQSIAENGGIAG